MVLIPAQVPIGQTELHHCCSVALFARQQTSTSTMLSLVVSRVLLSSADDVVGDML